MSRRWREQGGYLQVATNDVFQHGTLTARLAAYDGDLGKVDGVVDADGGEDILELVDEPRDVRLATAQRCGAVTTRAIGSGTRLSVLDEGRV